ncbi:MAG: methyl-accepting chemotaxis protein [Desulfovibrionaceae bacterium]|nr:methyl-accepting chemotaxis protein [Desulfovibrionaceae bacterium]
MTTKFKIIGGFIIMIVLLVGMAVLGYTELQKASDGFVEYRRNARVNVTSSDLQADMFDAAARTYDFLTDYDEKKLEAALELSNTFLARAKEGEGLTQVESRRLAFQDLQKQMADFKRVQDNLRNSALSLRNQFFTVVRPSYHKMMEQLLALGDTAAETDNATALHALTQVWYNLARGVGALGRLAESGRKEDAESASKYLGDMGKPLEEIGPTLQTLASRNVLKEVIAENATLVDAAKVMQQNAEARATALEALRKMSESMDNAANALSQEVDKGMLTLGDRVLNENDTAQKWLVGISAVGLLIGSLLAVAIILSIIRVLNDLSRFAGTVSKGDFSYQVKTREKGEIGAVVEAMKAIPGTLENILAEYRSLENNIEHGKLQSEGDVSRFQGEFAVLMRGTNAILSRFRMVVENIPSPVVMLTKDCQVAYLNRAGRDVAGTDYEGKTCKQVMQREDSDTPSDALRRAAETLKPVSAETRAHPQGKDMDISYTAIPMLDAKGELASVLQLITDLTAIRGQQRIMLQVAAQATEISNRVAAASEELSAQVEQVSRGAEMQRDRVDSTASAMTEMNATVLEVARSAGQASEQSNGTYKKAEQGADLVRQVTGAINAVNAVGQKLRSNMEELGKQAESIGGVMNVISDIADQTNLLALNAAIEAARAGEAGRGFAVVADEVRKLAEKTMQATQEVGSSISAVQHSARINIEEVGRAVASVEEATGLANSSGASLSEIVELATANSSVVASIATAAEQQSATSEEINHAIEEISRVVGETTEGMIQSSAAVQELSQMAQELRRVMEGLK